MLKTLKGTGWQNYSFFIWEDGGLDGRRPDEGFVPLDEVFHRKIN